MRMRFTELLGYKIAKCNTFKPNTEVWIPVPLVVPAYRVLDLPEDVSFMPLVVHNPVSNSTAYGYAKSYWNVSEAVTGLGIGIDQKSKAAAVESAMERIRLQNKQGNQGEILKHLAELYDNPDKVLNPQFLDEEQIKLNNFVKEMIDHAK